MKKLFGKRQVLLATLVVALGVAVYLNYYFAASSPDAVQTGGSSSTTVPTTSATRGNLGDSQFVNSTTSDALAVSVTTVMGTGSPYFRQARENRVKARQEAQDILSELLNDVKTTDAMKQEIVVKTKAMAEAVEQESKIESLVKAKGFTDCVVFIEGAKCSVVVQSEGLTPQQTLQISEIVTDQSSVKAADVKMVPVKE